MTPNREPAFTDSKPVALIGNGAWSLFLTLWAALVTFFLTPFLISRIGSSHYGLYVLLMALGGFLGIVHFGLGEATLRFVALYYGKKDLGGIQRVVGATLGIYMVTGLAGWALISLAAPLIAGMLSIPAGDRDLVTGLIRLTAIHFGLSFVSGAYGSIPKALQRYDISCKIEMLRVALHAAGIVAVLLAGRGIYEMLVWVIVSSLMVQAVNLVVARRLIPGIRFRPSLNRAGLREVFGYGVYSMITHMMGIVWGQADKLILGALVSSASVGLLAVPKQLAFRFSLAIGSAGGALFPKFSTMEDRGKMRALFLDSTWIMLSASVIFFVPLTVLVPDFLRLWIDPDFARQSAWVAQVIAFSCMVRGAFVPYSELFKGVGKPQYLSALFIFAGTTSLALNLLLIPKYGLAGAGYCYLATVVWGFLAIGFAWKRVLGAESLRPLFRSVAVPVLAGLLALSLSLLVRSRIDDPGWYGLFAFGGLFMLGAASLVGGTERLLGGRASHASVLVGSSARFLREALPARFFRTGRDG